MMAARCIEIAVDPRVLAEDLLVRLSSKSKAKLNTQTHPRILEPVAPGIERKRLHDPPVAVSGILEQDTLVLDGGEIVGGRPVLGAILGAPVDVGCRL